MAQSKMFEKVYELPTEKQKDVWKWQRKQLSFLVILPLLLFGISGRLDWVWGWVQVGLYVLAVAGMSISLLRINPSLLAERADIRPGTKKWDMLVVTLAASILPLAAWIVAALDYRYGWTQDFPVSVQIIAAVVWILSYGFTIWAMITNAFFSVTVRIQSERDHQVATDGPYRIVRHPGYLGAIIFQIAASLMLGSVWSLIPSGIAALLYVVRTVLEDRTLRHELPGYEAFTQQTRHRLVPGIW